VAIAQGIPAIPIAIGGCPPPGACLEQGTDANGNPWGKKCTLIQTPSTTDVSGFTTFTYSSANAQDIKALIQDPKTCGGKIPAVSVNTCINLNNGQMGTVMQEFYDVYSTNPDGLSGEANDPNPTDCGAIPVVAPGIQYNQCSNVLSFAKLCIRNVVSTGSPKYVYGDLTCNVSLYDPTATKCYLPRLVRDTKSGM
jgi:hypothetical protein